MCIEYNDNVIGYREDLIEEQRKYLSQMATDKNYCASEIEDAVKLIKSLEEEAKDGRLITISNNPMGGLYWAYCYIDVEEDDEKHWAS